MDFIALEQIHKMISCKSYLSDNEVTKTTILGVKTANFELKIAFSLNIHTDAN